MSDISPQEQLNRDIAEVQSDISSLQSKVRLSDVRDALEDLDTKTSGLAQKVRDLRARGYVFEKGLEAQAAGMASRWNTLRMAVVQQADSQASRLEYDLRSLQARLPELTGLAGNPAGAQPALAQIRSAISTLQGTAEAAARTVSGMYDAYQAEADQLGRHLQVVDWTLIQVAQATFRLRPTEGAIQAVEAAWVKGVKGEGGDPKGVLLLTDQRLVFEQKQEVPTKKVLFITTAKQKVQQLLWELPLGAIEQVKPSKRGLLGHEDHLELAVAPGTTPGDAHLHLEGQDCNLWQGLIGRAQSGDLDRDRAEPVDAAQVERMRQAPTACPNCGGKIAQQILRGMDSITCEWCGSVIRL